MKDKNLKVIGGAEIEKTEFNEDDYYNLIADEIEQNNFTKKAGIYFDAMAKLGKFKKYPFSEYETVYKEVRKRLLESNKRSLNANVRQEARTLLKSNKRITEAENQTRDIFISKVLSELDYEQRIELLKQCDSLKKEHEKTK